MLVLSYLTLHVLLLGISTRDANLVLLHFTAVNYNGNKYMSSLFYL